MMLDFTFIILMYILIIDSNQKMSNWKQNFCAHDLIYSMCAYCIFMIIFNHGLVQNRESIKGYSR